MQTIISKSNSLMSSFCMPTFISLAFFKNKIDIVRYVTSYYSLSSWLTECKHLSFDEAWIVL